MEVVAQLVRASDCGSEGRGFETRLPPQKKASSFTGFFYKVAKVLLHSSSSSVGSAFGVQGCAAPKTWSAPETSQT